jgi:hypothetical protein
MRKKERKTLLMVFAIGVAAILMLVLLINQSSPAGVTQGSVPRVSIAETRRALENGSAIVIDVRSPQAFQQSHISGAINVPLSSGDDYQVDAPLDALLHLY